MTYDHLGLRPLTTRSVLLSALLGSHPPQMPARLLVRIGGLFGIAEGTVRVTLSRMVAAGDLDQDGGVYRLTGRLLRRQDRQDEGRAARMCPWDGTWEIAVVTADRRPAAERVAFRQAMAGLRLAELREGTWLRPANLTRTRPDLVTERCTFLRGRPEGDPRALAAALWDLAGWAARARALEAALGEQGSPAEQFTVSAAVLRHLLTDPLLPEALLPEGWPGPALRARYERFDAEFTRTLSQRLGAPVGGHRAGR